jgi:hypothetical protein
MLMQNDIEKMLQEFQDVAGWDANSLICLMAGFIEENELEEELEAYLAAVAKEETSIG